MSNDITIRLATSRDVARVIDLIDHAAGWLRRRGTDQWAAPWPNAREREIRVREGMHKGRTFLLERGGELVATAAITDKPHPALWRPDEAERRAVYLHRLVVHRSLAGRKLGFDLIAWLGEWGRREYGADVMRIDVWADNQALHAYYQGVGFRLVDPVEPDGRARPRVAKEAWPSGVLMEWDLPRQALGWPQSAAFDRASELVLVPAAPEDGRDGASARSPR